MSISEISPIGLPQSLKYDQLPSIPDSVSSYSVSVAPSGLTSVAGASLSVTRSIANGTNGLFNQLFNTQRIDFLIPSGMNNNIFLDTRETTLSFRMVYTLSTGITAGTATAVKLKLIGSASSFLMLLL